MTSPPRVSVIVPAYYSTDTIAACLYALQAQTYRSFEIIVVNSSDETRTRDLVTGQFPEVTFRQHPTRLLPHAARNRGVAQARGSLLAFTDPDCRPAPDWLARLVAAHENGHALVGGGMDLAEPGWLARGIHLCKFWWALPGLPAGPSPYLPTANALYTRSVWQQVGPFPEDLFSGDAVLAWKAAARGYPAYFDSRAVVAHHHADTFAAFWRTRRTRGREFIRSRTAFEGWSRPRQLLYLLALPVLVGYVLARSGYAAVRTGWTRPYLVTLPVHLAGHIGWALGEGLGLIGLLFNPSPPAVPASTS